MENKSLEINLSLHFAVGAPIQKRHQRWNQFLQLHVRRLKPEAEQVRHHRANRLGQGILVAVGVYQCSRRPHALGLAVHVRQSAAAVLQVHVAPVPQHEKLEVRRKAVEWIRIAAQCVATRHLDVGVGLFQRVPKGP